MHQLFFVLILMLIGINTHSQFRWIFKDKGFSVVFPQAYKDTSYTTTDGLVFKASSLDKAGNHYVAECKIVSTPIPEDRYKAEWKKYHDKILADFLFIHHLEKTEEERFDVGKYHGIQAILNHKTQRFTFFYRNIIIGNHSITIYVIQPRTALNLKVVKKFYQSAKYKISLLK